MEIVIDWAKIEDIDSLYNHLFEQLKSPPWHGRNLDALWDSISGGDINGVEPPYKVVIKNEDQIREALVEFAKGVKEVFVTASRKNKDIEIVCKAA